MRSLFLLFLFPATIYSQINPLFISKENLNYSKVQASNEGMFGFEQGGKIGYMNKNGIVVIPAIYSYDSIDSKLYPSIPYFYKGYAKAVKNKKAGLIDKAGKIIIPIEHENITPYAQFGNFVMVTKTISSKKNFGMLTLQNKELLPVAYEEIRVDTNMLTVKQNGKWGLIDKTGKQLLPCEYTYLLYSASDKLVTAEKGTQCGLMDLNGKWLFEKSKSVFTLYGCRYGFVTCKVNNKYGYLDTKGNEVIITKYDFAYDFESNGLAKVSNKNPASTYASHYGYIDKKGNEIIPLKYDYLGSFTNGLISVKDPATNRYGYMDKTGKWVLKAVYLDVTSFDDHGGAWVKTTDNKFIYINKTGKEIGKLNEAGNYQIFEKDGYAVMESPNNSIAVIDKNGKILKPLEDIDVFYQAVNGMAGYKSKKTSKYGFLDFNGNKIIEPEFSGFTAFEDGVSKVDKVIDGKTKSGYIDDKGKIILPVVYEAAGVFRNGWGLVKKDDNYFFVDRNGNIKEPPRKYDEAYEFKSGYAIGKIKGTGTNPPTFYFINTQLKEEFSITASQVYAFWEDVAIISRDNQYYEMMNKKGEVFKKLSNIQNIKFCSNGMLAVRENNKWGFINDKGDMIVRAKYDSTESFKYGYGRVKLNGKWGIVDKTGTEIFEPKYDGIYPGENGVFIYYDKYWGIMDKTGKVLAPPGFQTLNAFDSDRSIAKLGKTYTILKSPLLK